MMAATAALVCVAPTQVSAQSIQEVMPKGLKAMRAGKFAEANQIFGDFTSNFDKERGTRLFGGHFGSAYYYKGRSEFSLGNEFSRLGGEKNAAKAKEFFQSAKESFSNSYSISGEGGKINKQQKISLFYKAQACQALGEYREAITLYEKFLAERNDSDKFSIGMYHVNLATCNFKLPKPDLKAGMTAFETALKNRERWKINDMAIVSAFQAFSQAVIAAKSESSMVDFLNQNRAVLTLKPYQMVEFTPFFQKLASEAIKADMLEAGFNLLALVPSSEVALADIEQLSKRIKNVPVKQFRDGGDTINKQRLASSKALLEKRIAKGDPPEVLALNSAAVVHEKAGYLRGAYAVYQQLEKNYTKSSRRENYLFQLFRIGSELGRAAESEAYGRSFLKNFPKSERAETVRVLILSSIFKARDYEKAKATASEWIDQLPKNSLQHDVCLHVIGGSLFYLGEYEKAKPYLEEHCKLYPESKFAATAGYLRAANYSQLDDYENAQKYLEGFIKQFSDPSKNIYLSYALFDLANVHFVQQEFDQSLVYLDRIEKEFGTAPIAGAAFNLKGSILQSQEGGEEKALAYFKKSYDMAKKGGSSSSESEALFYLISLLGDKNAAKAAGAKQEDVLPYFDEFWKKYQKSPYLANVVVSSAEALAKAGRYAVLLPALESSIASTANSKNTIVLVTAIDNYSKYYIENEIKNGASAEAAGEKLKTVYYKFPNVDTKNARTQAMLRVALIGVYEETYQHAKTEENKDLMAKMQGRITTTFKDLKAQYPVEQLSDFVLIKVGDYLRTKSSAPRQALPYYQELLKRKKGDYTLDAEFGVADVYGVAGSKDEAAKAIQLLSDIEKSNPEDTKIGGQAVARIVQIYATQKNWPKVIEAGRDYLKKYRSEKLMVQLLLAQAYDQTKAFNDAIAINMGIYSSNTSNWGVSVPAISRATELMWEHGAEKEGKSRKQSAYEVAARYIKNSRASFDKFKDSMSEDVRTTWRALDRRVQQWEEGGEIKTFKQIEAEQANQ